MGLFVNLVFENDGTQIAVPMILGVFELRGRQSHWKIKDAEACGYEIYERVHEYSDSEVTISGEEFYTLITPQIQLIEAWLESYDENSSKPWLIMQIRDGTCIDVVCDDESIYEGIKKIYPNATYHPAAKLIGEDMANAF